MPQPLYPQEKTLVPFWTEDSVGSTTSLDSLKNRNIAWPVRIQTLRCLACSLVTTPTMLLWLQLLLKHPAYIGYILKPWHISEVQEKLKIFFYSPTLRESYEKILMTTSQMCWNTVCMYVMLIPWILPMTMSLLTKCTVICLAIQIKTQLYGDSCIQTAIFCSPGLNTDQTSNCLKISKNIRCLK